MREKNKRSSTWGIASLLFSSLGILLFLIPFIGAFFCILGIIFAYIQKKRSPLTIATVGKVVGIIGIFLNILSTLLLIALFGFIAFVNHLGFSLFIEGIYQETQNCEDFVTSVTSRDFHLINLEKDK